MQISCLQILLGMKQLTTTVPVTDELSDSPLRIYRDWICYVQQKKYVGTYLNLVKRYKRVYLKYLETISQNYPSSRNHPLLLSKDRMYLINSNNVACSVCVSSVVHIPIVMFVLQFLPWKMIHPLWMEICFNLEESLYSFLQGLRTTKYRGQGQSRVFGTFRTVFSLCARIFLGAALTSLQERMP